MSQATTQYPPIPSTEPRPRVWPGVIIVSLFWLFIKAPQWIPPETPLGHSLASAFEPLISKMTGQQFPLDMVLFMASMFGAMAVVALFVMWWLLFSRVRWWERVLGLLAFVVIGAIAMSLYHPSVRGNRPDAVMFTLVYNILPVVFTGWVVWLAIARSFRRPVRLAGLCVVLALTWGAYTAVKFDGVTGNFSPEFSLRWQPTAEERLVASRGANTPAGSIAATTVRLELTPADWPAFRGADRDGRRPGVRIATDWKQNPPKPLWRHPVGPGWGSVAIVGLRLFTQEQLGSQERVVCYEVDTGAEVWAHTDETRHSDNESGAGPRATPTFDDGRIYALGATGRLNCLDAATGKRIWTRDIVADSGRDVAPSDSDPKVPIWGFSASPLVMKGIVTVFAGGPNGKAVLGYRADTGDLAWTAGNGTDSYCSLHPARINGVEQAIVATGSGLTAFDPADGKVLWEHEWQMEKGFARVVQPALVGAADVLLGSGFGNGTRRVRVSGDGATWTTEQVWQTKAIAPYFNDLVVHKGHIYGFHNAFFVCVNLETGEATWKERGYDAGQVLLLPDQDLLLIQTEKGDVALVEAKPDQRTELGRIPALKAKTWNHPVVAHGKLFVRNGEEMACYQLAEPSGTTRP